MADEAMNTLEQDTNVQEETPQVDENNSTATEPQEQTNGINSQTTARDGVDTLDNNTVDEGPFLMARYNKEDVPLTKEEATSWAQKGMHYHNKLDYIATISDCSVGELLDGMITKMDDAKRSELIEQFGEDNDTVEDMMRVYHDKQKEKYEKAIADRKQNEEQEASNKVAKLGEEFIALQKEFPELNAVTDLPASVVKAAENMSLEHAYLLYLRKNEKMIAEAKKQQEASANASGGSMQSAESVDTSFDDFARGVWGG